MLINVASCPAHHAQHRQPHQMNQQGDAVSSKMENWLIQMSGSVTCRSRCIACETLPWRGPKSIAPTSRHPETHPLFKDLILSQSGGPKIDVHIKQNSHLGWGWSCSWEFIKISLSAKMGLFSELKRQSCRSVVISCRGKHRLKFQG